MLALRSFIILSLLVVGLGCGESPSPACRIDSECAAGEACRDGVCERVDGGSLDAGPGGDAGPAGDAEPAGDAGPCAGACAPGEACMEGSCTADCRLSGAIPCAGGRICSDLSGRCVEPGEECTVAGEFVVCGGAEFAPVCGPGTRCDGDVCAAVAPCADLRCDAVGICRGVDCGGGMGGEVTGVTLDSVPDATRGLADGLAVGATVAGTDLCGVSVTFEVRIETALYTSAGNDGAVFEIDPHTGVRAPYISGLPLVFGLATDPTGALYLLRSDTCTVGRVTGVAGARVFEPVGAGPSQCSRLASGPDGALYVTGGLVVDRVDLFSGDVTRYGQIEAGVAHWGSTFLTGLAFDEEGQLVVGEHWRSLFTIAPDGVATLRADAPALSFVRGDNPWNEGIALGPDGSLYVGVFPHNPHTGFIYRVTADGSADVVTDLAGIQADVPTTNYTGIHGLAFGLDGTLYFTNQNTSGNTHEALGQLLVRQTDGTVRLLAEGFNFDWPRGYDGDLVLGTRVTDTATATVGLDGRVTATLDVPDEDGIYQVSIHVTDLSSGRGYTDRGTGRTL